MNIMTDRWGYAEDTGTVLVQLYKVKYGSWKRGLQERIGVPALCALFVFGVRGYSMRIHMHLEP